MPVLKPLGYVRDSLSYGKYFLNPGDGDLNVARKVFREALQDMLYVKEMPGSPEYEEAMKDIKTCLIVVNCSILLESLNRSLPKEYGFDFSDLKTILGQKDNVFVKAYNMDNKRIDSEIEEINELRKAEERNKGILALMPGLCTQYKM